MRRVLPLSAGRVAFGDDPTAYHAARPDYPDALYDRLAERTDLGAGAATFEVGPGTGLATHRLLAMGAAPLTAIEPDPRLARHLAEILPDPALTVRNISFEDADLAPASHDLGVAATSFHWLEQASALGKVRAVLRPGGWWAMWWTHFGLEEGRDTFQEATNHLFVDTPAGPGHGRKGRPFFALDREARLADLAAAGFDDAHSETWSWTLVMPTARLVALYATYSPVHALPPDVRATFLQSLAAIADNDFGGAVERPFSAVLYTARRPP
jgi:SAM-dependent methyltransferase